MPKPRNTNTKNKVNPPRKLAAPDSDHRQSHTATLSPSFDLSQKKVDYLCVLDFEATCDQKGQPRPQEIIEFPTLLLNVETGQVEDEFHYYIRPDVHPQLSEFCTSLTGIKQAKLDKEGIPLSNALRLHQEWLQSNGIKPWHLCASHEDKAFLYLTCGDWDLNTCLPRQLAYHGHKTSGCFAAWINVKKEFSNKYMTKAKGMTFMLNHFGLDLQGRHHSGIDDCRNIARVCQAMMGEGWKPNGPTD